MSDKTYQDRLRELYPGVIAALAAIGEQVPVVKDALAEIAKDTKQPLPDRAASYIDELETAMLDVIAAAECYMRIASTTSDVYPWLKHMVDKAKTVMGKNCG